MVFGARSNIRRATAPAVLQFSESLHNIVSLGDTDRGPSEYGSTGVKAATKNENSVNDERERKARTNVQKMNGALKVDTPLSQSRQLITARQMSKLANGDHSIFLAIVRPTNETPQVKKTNKRSFARATRFAAAHGMSEGQRRVMNKSQGPKKDIISVAEREQQVLDGVPICHRERLSHLIQQYRDIFPEQLPKDIPLKRVVEHTIKVELGSKPSYRPPYRLGPACGDLGSILVL